MSNVPAKFASALFLGVAAGAVWTMLPQRAVFATDNCLTQPTDQTQGRHWYYHIERGTGRHCWYLRGEDEKSARAETPVAATPEKPALRSTEASPSRSIADAHAEMPPRAHTAGDAPAAAPSVWPSPASAPRPASGGAAGTPVPNAPASSLASRWPQTSGTGMSGAAATASQSPESQQPPDASLMLADVQAADSTTEASADASQSQPPPAAAPVERNTGSIQKLLMVAAGALALAGLTGSAVYRLGRRRRRNDWLRERTAWQSAQNPNNPPWLEPQFADASSIPDLDEARLLAQESNFSHATSEGDQTDDRVEKIEEYLARLTRQLQNEMKRPAAARDVRAES